MFQNVRIKTETARVGQTEGTAQADTKTIWQRTVQSPARNAAAAAAAAAAVEVVVVVEAEDQGIADLNPEQELWVVLKPPKELGPGRH